MYSLDRGCCKTYNSTGETLGSESVSVARGFRGGSRNVEVGGGGDIVWVYIYMEKSDRACADANSYTRTQTEQSGNKSTRTV